MPDIPEQFETQTVVLFGEQIAGDCLYRMCQRLASVPRQKVYYLPEGRNGSAHYAAVTEEKFYNYLDRIEAGDSPNGFRSVDDAIRQANTACEIPGIEVYVRNGSGTYLPVREDACMYQGSEQVIDCAIVIRDVRIPERWTRIAAEDSAGFAYRQELPEGLRQYLPQTSYSLERAVRA